jgi:Phage capsid family
MNYSTPEPRRGIPLRPDRDAVAQGEALAWRRAFVSNLLGHREKKKPVAVARSLWDEDLRTRAVIERAASDPPLSTTTGAPFIHPWATLQLLAPTSAAAALFALAHRLSFQGVSTYRITSPTAGSAVASFVAENAAAPLIAAQLATPTVIGPPQKMLALAAVTEELLRATPDDLVETVGSILGEAVAWTLDGVAFGSSAATAAQPAGLLASATSVVATPAGGTKIDTIAEDVSNLVAVFSGNRIGGDVAFVAAPPTTAKMRLAAGYATPLKIFDSPQVPANRLIAIALRGLFAGDVGELAVESSSTPEIAFDTAPPASIDTALSSTSVRSAFQVAMTIIKLRMRTTWGALPHCVAFIDGVTW